MLAPLALSCQGAPQIVAISPERNAGGVRTNLPVKISFDRPVDQATVAARFRLAPSTTGEITWDSPRSLAFNHAPLRPDTEYTVLLGQGYRDRTGNVNDLDHSWRFRTEAAPALVSSSPSPGDGRVDPASFIMLTFNREMDPQSLASAISLRPGIAPFIRLDPADPRRVLVAPDGLLQPGVGYAITVTSEARDADGNHLQHGAVISFGSGPSQPLRHRITFLAAPTGGSSQGVWMVDESRFPRPLAPGSAVGYDWSGDGGHLLLRDAGGGWIDQQLGGEGVPLPVEGGWASFLGTGQGYVYLRGNEMWQHPSAGADQLLAAGVQAAAVAPGGLRLAYVTQAGTGSEIWGLDVGLQARYRLQAEAGTVAGLAWAPDGSRLAYLTSSAATGQQIRVRTLSGSGGVATLVTGEVDPPTWQSDSRHLVFSAPVDLPGGGSVRKVFRLSITDPAPHTLSLALGLPAGHGMSASQARPSPDGHQIAFLGEQNGSRQVFLMNADGTGLAQLTSYDPDAFPYSCSLLAWTPA